ncbi:hypothetical protein [Nocardia sp. X0981]
MCVHTLISGAGPAGATLVIDLFRGPHTTLPRFGCPVPVDTVPGARARQVSPAGYVAARTHAECADTMR